MSETQPTYRCFHPFIVDAYTSVHQWIETNVQDADGYRNLPYSNLKQKLQATDWKHIAFQYYALFPAHYFKAAYTLDSIIGEEQIITWLRHRQKICIGQFKVEVQHLLKSACSHGSKTKPMKETYSLLCCAVPCSWLWS